MKRIISFLAIIVLIMSTGCQKQSAPTSLDETNLSAQKPDNNREAPDLSHLRKQIEAKSKFIQEKLSQLQNQNPANRQPKSFAKATGIIKVPGDYPTIQEAVDAAGEGAVINVSGTFNENVFIDGKTNLTINGSGAATVMGQPPYYAPFAILESENVAIKGFNLIGLVYISETRRAIIRENDISGLGDGIQALYGSSGCIIAGNTIHDKVNGGFGTGDAIYLEDAYNNVIKDNHILNNNDGFGTAIAFGGNNTHQNNIISNNASGIVWYYSNQNSVKDSKISLTSDAGILGIGSSENEIKDSESCQNVFGVLFDSCSVNLIKDVVCNDNYIGGIDFLNACLNNTIIGAETNNNILYEGIYFDYDTANNTVKDSEAYGNGSCDVVDLGTDNIFINNQFGSFNCSM